VKHQKNLLKEYILKSGAPVNYQQFSLPKSLHILSATRNNNRNFHKYCIIEGRSLCISNLVDVFLEHPMAWIQYVRCLSKHYYDLEPCEFEVELF
jgi:hypothetical protein